METPTTPPQSDLSLGAEISDYVAHMQLHMALQARNLMPDLMQSEDSLQSLILETQAQCEKLSSRQGF